MSLRLVFTLIFSFSTLLVISQPLSFDKQLFYKVISKDNIGDIDGQLTKLDGLVMPEKNSYEGALLMKKSGLVKNSREKLKLFKAGREKLESSISKNNGNIEYRFLRVIIQEHAPKIVKYHNNLDEDTALISSMYKNLTPDLQAIILDYSRSSKFLKIQKS
ncbi:MAG: hypothetical protein ABIW38_01975 [Ferruginibacter sp.]